MRTHCVVSEVQFNVERRSCVNKNFNLKEKGVHAGTTVSAPFNGCRGLHRFKRVNLTGKGVYTGSKGLI